MAIELDDVLKILQEVRSRVGVQPPPPTADPNATPNPPGWTTQPGFQGDPGIAVRPPGSPPDAPPQDDPGLETPASPGFKGDPLPGKEGDQWQPRTYAYGHLATLTEQQAAAFQMMMLIQGHNGDTVGRGHVIDHTPNTGREQVAGA